MPTLFIDVLRSFGPTTKTILKRYKTFNIELVRCSTNLGSRFIQLQKKADFRVTKYFYVRYDGEWQFTCPSSKQLAMYKPMMEYFPHGWSIHYSKEHPTILYNKNIHAYYKICIDRAYSVRHFIVIDNSLANIPLERDQDVLNLFGLSGINSDSSPTSVAVCPDNPISIQEGV